MQNATTHCAMLQHKATHCNTLTKCGAWDLHTPSHTAIRCNKLQHATTHCNTLRQCGSGNYYTLNTRYNKLQHAAIHCNTLRHCGAGNHHTLQHTAPCCNTPPYTATHCNTLQHTATHCNTLVRGTITPWNSKLIAVWDLSNTRLFWHFFFWICVSTALLAESRALLTYMHIKNSNQSQLREVCAIYGSFGRRWGSFDILVYHKVSPKKQPEICAIYGSFDQIFIFFEHAYLRVSWQNLSLLWHACDLLSGKSVAWHLCNLRLFWHNLRLFWQKRCSYVVVVYHVYQCMIYNYITTSLQSQRHKICVKYGSFGRICGSFDMQAYHNFPTKSAAWGLHKKQLFWQLMELFWNIHICLHCFPKSAALVLRETQLFWRIWGSFLTNMGPFIVMYGALFWHICMS